MVLPLVPLVLFGAGGVGALTGLVTGAIGGVGLKQAREVRATAAAAYEAELELTSQAVTHTNKLATAYCQSQAVADHAVLGRMRSFLRRHARQVADSELRLLDGVQVAEHDAIAPVSVLADVGSLAPGLALAGAAGAGTSAGVPMAVAAYGTASTGAAISGLSGAALKSATMAALGGGAVSTGGGGVALGVTALNVVTIGPALLVSGLVVRGTGQRAKTRAAQYEAEVALSGAEQQALRTLLTAVDRRFAELDELLALLSARAAEALDLLESEPFDPAVRAEPFRNAMRLSVSLRDVVATPVLTEEGSVNDDALALTVKYKEHTRV